MSSEQSQFSVSVSCEQQQTSSSTSTPPSGPNASSPALRSNTILPQQTGPRTTTSSGSTIYAAPIVDLLREWTCSSSSSLVLPTLLPSSPLLPTHLSSSSVLALVTFLHIPTLVTFSTCSTSPPSSASTHATLTPEEPSLLPQTPWTLPPGTYYRPDGTPVHLQSPTYPFTTNMARPRTSEGGDQPRDGGRKHS